MNDLKIFTNDEFGSIRTVEVNGQPWLVGKDVAEALGYTNPQKAIRDHVDDDDKTVNESFSVNGTMAVLINESGVYSLVFSSKLPDAKKFKHWVTAEVLPSIRKHGMYATDELLANPDFAIQVFQQLKEEREARRLADAKVERLEEQNAIKDQHIAEMEPKATYYDEVLKCRDSLPTSIIAKDYGWSAKRLNKFLEENGVQYKLHGTWLLKQKYAGFGYTKSETFPYEGSTGNVHTAINTKWTQKGRLFIYELMKKNGNLPLIEKEF